MAERSRRHVPVTLHDLHSRKPDVLALLMLVGYMLLGTVYFHLTLGWSWIDAMYFSFTTTLTVGYGDFNPEQSSEHKPAMMICTILYVIVGVGLIGACLGMVVGDAAERVQAVQARSQRTLILLGLVFFLVLMSAGAIGMARHVT